MSDEVTKREVHVDFLNNPLSGEARAELEAMRAAYPGETLFATTFDLDASDKRIAEKSREYAKALNSPAAIDKLHAHLQSDPNESFRHSEFDLTPLVEPLPTEVLLNELQADLEDGFDYSKPIGVRVNEVHVPTEVALDIATQYSRTPFSKKVVDFNDKDTLNGLGRLIATLTEYVQGPLIYKLRQDYSTRNPRPFPTKLRENFTTVVSRLKRAMSKVTTEPQSRAKEINALPNAYAFSARLVDRAKRETNS